MTSNDAERGCGLLLIGLAAAAVIVAILIAFTVRGGLEAYAAGLPL